MLTRSFDSERANELVNHPSIRPFVGGDGESFLDLSPSVDDEKNVFLIDEHGGFLLIWTAPDTYEIHTFILPEGRGRKAYANAQDMLRTMKQEFGARHLWTRVARGQENVRRFTTANGLEHCGEQTCDFGGGPTHYDLFNWRHKCLLQQ